MINKQILNFLVIISLSCITFWWTFFIFHQAINWEIISIVIVLRITASLLIFKDYSLSWSKASQRTFLLKSVVVAVPLIFSILIYYQEIRIAFLLSEAATYMFSISFLMYSYHYYINRNKSGMQKTKSLVLYGAGKAGHKLEEEFRHTQYKVMYYIDDDKSLQGRSIDTIKVISKSKLKELIGVNKKLDMLIIAIPSAPKERIKEIHQKLNSYFKQIKILPPIHEILEEKNYTKMLQNISVEDLLARHPKDLDKTAIKNFVYDKKVLITGAGGSIGSEISRQCAAFGVRKLILLDHSEFNLYRITEELIAVNPISIMQSVNNRDSLEKTFDIYRPDIVIHAAAYKHVPLVENNMTNSIINNVLGTKHTIDCAIAYGVKKFVLISTDKAVKPTNVMGATKRICELYAQNVDSDKTEIVAVRFGNVLGSSGSVIPKFKSQIASGGPITVTHPEITRYFMLIPEACELVLQAASIGRGGEIFILDMGAPIKIIDLAYKMIELSGRDIKVEFIGLRPGEKLYEELLINSSDMKTKYDSITVAGKTEYRIQELNQDIFELLNSEDKLTKLKEIVPEFNHSKNL